MNSKIAVALVVLALGAASVRAGLIAARTVEVLQGPSSRTTIIGPDGSAVASSAPGGTVVTDGQSVIPAGPAILAAAGPEVVVAGPAGSIATVHTLAGPAVVPVAAAPVAIPAAAHPALVVAPTISAHEGGDYVPDNTEQLYDDGSYKGE